MENKKWYENAHMMNRDPDWVFHGIDATSKEACQKSLENYFGEYSKGNLTDVHFCIFSQTSMIPSKSFYWLGEKYLQKKENGFDVDYTKQCEKIYKCYEEYHIDAVEIFLDQMKKAYIRPWVSFRMNDAHCGYVDTSFMHSDLFYEELAAGHMIGDQYGYFGRCFDYKYPKYKNALLGLMKEVVDNYDFFGLELDFLRESFCFDHFNNPDCHKIMTEFVRDVRKILDEAEKRLGHEMKLMIRIPSFPDNALAFGFDVKTMCDEGLIDIINPCARWMPTASDIPIEKWRELTGSKIPIMAGIEFLNLGLTHSTAENVKAYIASFYSRGADGIYLYNYMYPGELSYAAWNMTKENVLEGRRDFIVTTEDNLAYSDRHHNQLPIVLDGTGSLDLVLGKIKMTDEVTMIIDYEGDEPPMLSVCTVKDVAPTAAEPIIGKRGDGTVVEFTPHSPLKYDLSGIETDKVFDMVFSGTGKINYMRIIIDAK